LGQANELAACYWRGYISSSCSDFQH
jgi:hypothetical protein